MTDLKHVIIWASLCCFLSACLPKAPQYPFKDATILRDEAQKISDRMDEYVNLWFDGKVSSILPDSVIPEGVDMARFKYFKLVKPEDVQPREQWALRPAGSINPDSLRGYFPDPNATYLVIFNAFVPFGHKIVIEGEFPFSRFMSAQFTPPFNGEAYRYSNYAGVGEVGYLDTDIIPKQGNVNTFVPGNDRMAKNRAYRVVFGSSLGFSNQLNEGYYPPDYRVKDSVCYGSGIQCQGPWGLDKRFGHGRGIWDVGEVWIRYYAIDKGRGSLGGVALPEVYYVTPKGQKYFIVSDLSSINQQSNATAPMRVINPKDPDYRLHGPYLGWNKQFDIFLIITQGLSQALNKTEPNHKKYVRELQLGVTGRGGKQPAPHYFEPHATGCLYGKYLLSGMNIGKEKLYILTGKLPTFPDTRGGAKTLDTAQCRYWSITGYDSNWPFAKIPGLAVSSIMDDEVITDEDGNYIIVYSREEDRPINATPQNGVTWVNWGTTGIQSFTLRWFDIGEEWTMPLAPNEENLPWPQASLTGSDFDPTLTARNSHDGIMKEYLPKRHYMELKDFEALGQRVISWKDIPEWTYEK